MYTSGSTGKPKPIPHTHAGVLWWARAYSDALPDIFPEGEEASARGGSLSFTPYFHVMGFVANTARARHAFPSSTHSPPSTLSVRADWR